MAQNKKTARPRDYQSEIARATEIPVDALMGAHIELLGSNELSIDGHKGLLQYDEGEIKFSLGAKIVSVSGRRLVIKGITTDCAMLAGEIVKIEFIEL